MREINPVSRQIDAQYLNITIGNINVEQVGTNCKEKYFKFVGHVLDDKFTWTDARYFIDPVKKLFEAVDNIEEVIPEITDIDDEEYDELVAYVREKWDYIEENLEWVVDTAIEAGRSILTLVTMSDKKA